MSKNLYREISRDDVKKMKEIGINKEFLSESDFNYIINNEKLMKLIHRLNEFRKEDCQALYSYVNKNVPSIQNTGSFDVWFTLETPWALVNFVWSHMKDKKAPWYISLDTYYEIFEIE